MTPSSSAGMLTRRTMLKATAAAGGGLMLSLSIPELTPAFAAESGADFAPNAFVRIDWDSKITFTIPQVEMGQGIYTALSMILAEELDAPFENVTAVAAPPNDKLYANPIFGFQVTGGSTSIRAFWNPMQIAGASARAMLVQAATAKWDVDPASCRTENGEVLHDTSGRKAAYGELAQAAAELTPPQYPPLKSPANFKLIGKSLKRLDTPDKVNGKAVYGIDARPDGLKIATLASCPVLGGKVAHVDDAGARSVPGVRQVIVLDDLVAVVGDHMWAAKQGLGALDITWDEGPNAAVSTEERSQRPHRGERESGRGREIDRRRREGPGRGDET
jgi:isoquinoline 1-oxidoreductase beta subunit